jgi:DNA-binding Lrp family transcriptional regulator
MRPILNRLQKDQRIIELYEQGYPVAEICSLVGASATTVTDRINRYKESKEPRIESVMARAFSLYNEGKSPLEVAISLELSADDAEKFYKDYLRLKGLGDLFDLYSRVGYILNDFLDFYWKCKFRNIEPQQVAEAMAVSVKIPKIYSEQRAAVQKLVSVQYSIKSSGDQINKLDLKCEFLDSTISLKEIEIDKLSGQISGFQGIENAWKNTEFNKNVWKFVVDEVSRIFNDKKLNLITLTWAIIKVVQQNPEFLTILCPPLEGYYYNADLHSNYIRLVEQTMDELKDSVLKATSKVIYEEAKKVVYDLNRTDTDPIEAKLEKIH